LEVGSEEENSLSNNAQTAKQLLKKQNKKQSFLLSPETIFLILRKFFRSCLVVFCFICFKYWLD